MHRLLFVLLPVLLLAACSDPSATSKPAETRQQPVPTRYSAAFNSQMENTLRTYDSLSEAFVHWDSTRAMSLSRELQTGLGHIELKEITGDSARMADVQLGKAKTAVAGMLNSKTITEMRYGFNTLSDHFFQFLSAARYDRAKIFLHQCTMAFNDTGTGVWVSRQEEIRNPYLGLRDPRYGKGMLKCGENKSVVNYTGTK